MLGAGAIGLGQVGVRHATDLYNYKSSFIEIGTKAFQVVLPLLSTVCFFGPCMGCCGNDITEAEHKELEAESARNSRCIRLLLACVAAETALQICC